MYQIVFNYDRVGYYDAMQVIHVLYDSAAVYKSAERASPLKTTWKNL